MRFHLHTIAAMQGPQSSPLTEATADQPRHRATNKASYITTANNMEPTTVENAHCEMKNNKTLPAKIVFSNFCDQGKEQW